MSWQDSMKGETKTRKTSFSMSLLGPLHFASIEILILFSEIDKKLIADF